MRVILCNVCWFSFLAPPHSEEGIDPLPGIWTLQSVGLYDKTVRVLSLDPDDCLQTLGRQVSSNFPVQPVAFLIIGSESRHHFLFVTGDSVQALIAEPESLALVQMGGSGGASDHKTLYMFVGLANGVMLRTVMDNVTGEMSDTRRRCVTPSSTMRHAQK